MKKTMRRQITIAFIGLVVGMLIISLIISTFFLEKIYIANKKSQLIKVYEKLEQGRWNELEEETTINNVFFYVESGGYGYVPEWNMDERNAEELMVQLKGYQFGRNQKVNKLLEAEEDHYEIYSALDVQSKEEYLEMWGHLSDGSAFIARSPLESIRTSASVANRFQGNIMIIMLLLAGIYVSFYAKRITNPIMELAELSNRMADLDFEAKYTSGGDNEIGILGENFNLMSGKLEQTISELKNANYELQRDIEKKEATEQMRTEFIGNVSHELKTPIALIQGYAEGLRDGVVDDADSRQFYCDVIIDEANKMNQLVKNLLTLNQMEFGKEEVSYSRFNVVELMEGVLQSAEIRIRQKEADVRFQQTDPVYVWADEFKVEQVFRNYFDNALNHLGGDNVIDVCVQEKKEEGAVRISVFNTGNPIPEEDIGHIWEKFYKVDKARTREYGGNGIGLSIVKAIMVAFHRDYGVTNYDNGVSFWFELDAG